MTYEYLIACLSYNQYTGLFAWKYRIDKPDYWNKKYVGRIAGSDRHNGYLGLCINNKTYYAHKLAWLYFYKEFPSKKIDHINGNKHDNRIENIRLSTNSQNQQNLKKALKNNKSKLLGVHARNNGTFYSCIKLNGKSIHLGTFKSKIDAHNAYLDKKREIHEYCTI